MNKSVLSEEIKIKRFGYIISAVLLVLSNIALLNEWNTTPIIFLVTMYFLTGTLWVLSLIKPFYVLCDTYILKKIQKDRTGIDTDKFSKN
jgi:hypothetical protein